MKYLQKRINKHLLLVEKWGNSLPNPATLFVIMSIVVLFISLIANQLGWSVVSPTSGELVYSENLLSKKGINDILINLVENFTGFAPLGVVLVAMLGFGIVEDSGLISATIRMIIASTPKKLITFVIIFTGVMSNIASDAGHILVIPLAGLIFLSIGRHPIVGLAAAFAGVSGCYSANMLLGTLDPTLAGLSTEAAKIINPLYDVNPTGNYFFLATSAIVLSLVGTWVTEKFVAPRFDDYENKNNDKTNLEELTHLEKKGLKIVTITSIVILIIILATLLPKNGFFRGEDGAVLSSPLIKGIIAFIFLFASLVGIIFGVITKKYKSDSDVLNGMSKSIKALSTYIILVFFASQFVAFFKMSKLGVILAVKGANFIQNTHLEIFSLTIMFILFSAIINLLMGSASAKWAIMAPIFIPMFMLAGYSPEFTQAVFRIGDSSTNIISPMLSFYPLVIVFFQKYDKKSGLGTVVATMLPYTIAFLVVWSLLMVVWIVFDLPVGPGADILYNF